MYKLKVERSLPKLPKYSQAAKLSSLLASLEHPSLVAATSCLVASCPLGIVLLKSAAACSLSMDY